ncbi:3-keto-disaccharide hydrolase [Gemmata sp.]|uniref:3-keto-disaccharide hydrolase n=1 Tax=Gemmata sp. TaxID=1914242 RepID=UPI003F7187A1
MRLATAAACVILLFAASARADDKPKQNTLTPKEIADGWLLLFDGETTFGWTIEGEVTVKDGWLVLGGTKATTATCNTALPAEFVALEIKHASDVPDDKQARLSLNSKSENAPLKGKSALSAFADGALTRPKVTVPAGTVVQLRHIRISHAAASTKLFDGKTIDGWKVNGADPKRMASKFEVTKDGELSVKNGPGDLVTEKEFDNFVLQFECKTLGEGLNSGFFFRCIPGQYQNGYETQVQNSYLDNDRTKPKDFGTGAIYRRVASRKVVSNDKEWFTMTVVADGKHIATWVNGYQTVDWTDDRKESENPRQGYRAAKGPISIQGHDPTTDLLFRNIRIAPLGTEKKD